MNHESLQALVLSLEDLTEEERRIAEAHLVQCADCRELLAKLSRIEFRAADLGTLPQALDHVLYRLSPSEEHCEGASRQALITKLDAETCAGGKR